jgi:hypothetical protein
VLCSADDANAAAAVPRLGHGSASGTKPSNIGACSSAACPDQLLPAVQSALQLAESALAGYKVHCAAQGQRQQQAALRAAAGL